MIVGGENLGGSAPTFPGEYLHHPEAWADSAYAVVSAETLMNSYIFTHELGHLFGAAHDRRSTGGSKGAFCASYGHVQPTTKAPGGPWKTIMSPKENCDRRATRLHWSSPATDKFGEFMGSEHCENNALTISTTASTIAELHCYLGPPTGGKPSITPDCEPIPQAAACGASKL